MLLLLQLAIVAYACRSVPARELNVRFCFCFFLLLFGSWHEC